MTITLAACGVGDEPEAGAAFEVHESAGIEILENASPAWGEGEGWTIDAEPILQIGAVEGEEAYQFSSISGAVRFPDGRIAVAERSRHEIRLFSAEGEHLASFGREGAGPGEFQEGPIIALARPDTVLAWDPQSQRISWFDTGGALLREESLRARLAEVEFQNNLFPTGWRLRGDGTVLSDGTDLEERPDRLLMFGVPVLVSDLGGTISGFGRLPRGYSVTVQPGIGVGHPFMPISRTTLGSDPYPVVISGPEAWEVHFFLEDGSLGRIVRAAIPRTLVTDEMLDSARARFRSIAEARNTDPRIFTDAFDDLDIPDSIPAILELHSDGGRHLWVGRRTAPGMLYARVYDVIDPRGRWLGSVEMPPDPGSILQVGDDYILAQWRDELNVPYVRLYRIRKGPGR